MTKEEAIKAMEEGKQVTHRWFSNNEWMKIVDYVIVFEDGVKCTLNEFWRYRTDESWNDGYEIIN